MCLCFLPLSGKINLRPANNSVIFTLIGFKITGMGNKHTIRVGILLCLILLVQQVHATTLFVINTNNSGAGSFRDVLQNALNGDVIQFNIPGAGPHTIKPLASYSISKQITIDGLSAGKPNIEFDGSLCTNMTCFDFNSVAGTGTIIQGLAINNFVFNSNACGIMITQAGNVTIKSCYIGTDITATIAKPNNNGIFILASSNNTIGGTNAADGNIVSGNTVHGIWISGQGGAANNNTVENNKVGIDINGNALANFTGVEYQLGAFNNIVKHNNISYNTGDGLSFNQTSTGNKIHGNIFSYNGEHGVDMLNSNVMNNVVGVDVSGVGEPNEIFNNGQAGVFISEWYNDGASMYQGGAPSKVTVRKNLIYCNGVKGIALVEKTGLLISATGNSGKASPVINITSNEEKTFGTGTPGDIIDLYVADACNLCYSGNSQGQTWLASVVVAGDGSWSYTKVGGAPCNSLIVTATDALGNTSEFASSCVRPMVAVNDTSTCTTITLNLDVTQICATSYQWSTGAITPTITLTNAAPGKYWVELKGIDNVAVRDTFEILQKSIPNVNLGADLSRCSDPFIPAVILNPGLPNSFIYEWSTSETTPSISVNNRGQYFVKVTDNMSTCSKSDTLEITQNSVPLASLSNAQFCEGDSVLLDPGNNFTTYKWSDNSVDSTLKVKSAGVYWVVVKNAAGCTDSVSATITVNALPSGKINDTTVCGGVSVVMDAGIWQSYLWDNNGVSQISSFSSNGKHWVIVANNKNCKDTLFFQLALSSVPEIDLGNDTALCFMELGAAFKITVPDTFTTVSWMNNNSTSSIEITEAQTVIVTVFKGTCSANDTLFLSDHCTPLVWDFPNWVSPNGDGKNDHFYPKYVNDSTLGKLKETYFVVYDRWGIQMYERSRVVEIPEWDATYMGQTVSPGVYYWIVKWTDTADKKGEATGWMQVMY